MIFRALSLASPIVFIQRSTASYANPENLAENPRSRRRFLHTRKTHSSLLRLRFFSFGVEDFVILVCDGKKNDYYSRRGIWSNKQRVKEPRQGRAWEVTLLSMCFQKILLVCLAFVVFVWVFLIFREASKSIVSQEFKLVFRRIQWTLLASFDAEYGTGSNASKLRVNKALLRLPNPHAPLNSTCFKAAQPTHQSHD